MAKKPTPKPATPPEDTQDSFAPSSIMIGEITPPTGGFDFTLTPNDLADIFVHETNTRLESDLFKTTDHLAELNRDAAHDETVLTSLVDAADDSLVLSYFAPLRAGYESCGVKTAVKIDCKALDRAAETIAITGTLRLKNDIDSISSMTRITVGHDRPLTATAVVPAGTAIHELLSRLTALNEERSKYEMLRKDLSQQLSPVGVNKLREKSRAVIMKKALNQSTVGQDWYNAVYTEVFALTSLEPVKKRLKITG